MTVLVLVGLDSLSSHLDLSSADLGVIMDSGPGQWEPQLGCPVIRLVSAGTLEDGLTRTETRRKILREIKSISSYQDQSVCLSGDTLADIVNPSPDMTDTVTFTKRKEKVKRQKDVKTRFSTINVFSV